MKQEIPLNIKYLNGINNLGCNNGGLDYNIVKEMIMKELGDLNCKYTYMNHLMIKRLNKFIQFLFEIKLCALTVS